ncbi:PH domain-containing protein [Aquimarina sp. 2201CG1-2-11]|uniref:PH domain-containing protein n=1 Tax=Aquimarina discodermiae TaxID=3231043 RepID=UPI003463592B
MKFKSRKDILFFSVFYGFISFFIGMFILDITNNGLEKDDGIVYLVILAVLVLLIWMYHGTTYELTENYLKYKSGPISGKVELHKITKIIQRKTLWVGLKPATAKNGLIIMYEKYSKLYISPKTNETFLKQTE